MNALLFSCTLYFLNKNIAKIIPAARLNASHNRERATEASSLWRSTFLSTLNGLLFPEQVTQTQIAPRAKWELGNQPEDRIITPTQQWRYLKLTRNSFYILFHAKGIVSYRQIISSRLYVRLRGTCSLAGRALVNKLNNVNANDWTIPKKHRGPRIWHPCTKRPWHYSLFTERRTAQPVHLKCREWSVRLPLWCLRLRPRGNQFNSPHSEINIFLRSIKWTLALRTVNKEKRLGQQTKLG